MASKKSRRKLNVKKKFAIVLLIIVVLFILGIFYSFIAQAEETIPNATKNFYVNDFGEVFTEQQEQEMMKRAVELAYKPEGVQVVVTTVKSLNGLSVEDYATMMYNKYGIGKDDRGILILLSIQERKVRIEVGYALESYMTDSKAGKFIKDYAIEYLKNNQFDLGLMSLQKAVVEDLDFHFESARATPIPTEVVTDAPIQESTAITRGIVDDEDQKQPVLDSASVEKNLGNNTMSLIGWISAALMFIGFLIQSIRHRNIVKQREYEDNQYEKKIENREATICSLNGEKSELKKALDEQKNINFEHRKRCSQLESVVNSLENNNKGLNEKLKDLQKKIEEFNKLLDDERAKNAKLSDRYARAKKLHEGLDSSIDEMINKEIDEKNRQISAEFDSKYSFLTTGDFLKKCREQGPKGYISFEEMYRRAFTAYESLSSDQKKYVKTDMEEVRKRYDEGVTQKSKEDAEYFKKTLEPCIQISHGKESNLQTFKKIHRSYKEMDERTRGFIDVSLIQTLEKLIREGEDERTARIAREEAERKRKEEEERKRKEAEEAERRRREEERRRREAEEERRRRIQEEEEERRRNDSFNSSFGGFDGGFGGFGGSSGGGGASSSF